MPLAGDIVRKGNPLEIEKKLLHLRWMVVDSMELMHHFDFEYLILYFIRLQILGRLCSFDKEKGLDTFDRLCEVRMIDYYRST